MADISEIFSNTPVTANAAPCAVKTDFFKGWVHVDFVDSFMSAHVQVRSGMRKNPDMMILH